MLHEPLSAQAGVRRWSTVHMNETGAFERPCPGQRPLPSALGNAGSCRSYRGDHAQLPNISNLNPCPSKHLNYQPGFQWLPLPRKPVAHPGHAGEQTCFRSQIWGSQAAPAMAAPLFWPRRKAAPKPLHRSSSLLLSGCGWKGNLDQSTHIQHWIC